MRTASPRGTCGGTSRRSRARRSPPRGTPAEPGSLEVTAPAARRCAWAAEKAGIEKGDVILEVDGQPTPTTDVLVTVLAQLKPGQTVPVKILRPDGKRETVDVTLGELKS